MIRRFCLPFLVLTFILLTQIAFAVATCPSNQFYFNDKCYAACSLEVYLATNNGVNPDGVVALYANTPSSQVCVSECSHQCTACLNYADFCTVCAQPANDIAYLLESQGKCLIHQCPVYHFQNNIIKTCISCSNLPLNCKNCTTNYQCVQNGGSLACDQSNAVLCKSCDPSYYSLIDSNGLLLCISTIPDGYVSINMNLTACASDCLTCKDYPTSCLTCETLNFINSQCLPTCPLSHYSLPTSTTFNSIQLSTLTCTRCKPKCNTCTNQTFCLSCLIDYYLLPSSGLCILPTACPEKTYTNTSTYTCDQCNTPCVRCFNGNQCKECIAGLNLLGKACASPCPDTMYQSTLPDPLSHNSLTAVCITCVPPCQKCIDSTQCLSCLYSSGLIYYQQQNECVPQCPKGLKADSTTKKCVNCPANCSACDENQCLQCQVINGMQYILFEQKCISQCPYSYHVNDQIINSTQGNANQQTVIKTCALCPSSCESCSNQTYCMKCKPNFYFNTNTCLQKCPQQRPVQTSIPSNPTLYQCEPCTDQLCLSCTKLDYCLKCMNDNSTKIIQATILINGTCQIDCPQLYIKKFSQVNHVWACEPDTSKQVDNVTGQVVPIPVLPAKGIIMSVFIPFIVSYATAGITVIVGVFFWFARICHAKRGLYFPFVTGLLALPETVAIGRCLFYHFMFNYYDYFERLKFMPQIYVFMIALFIYFILNITNMVIFMRIFYNDESFWQWNSHSSVCSKFLLSLIVAISIANFKFQNIFWSKFSTFPVLCSVQKLKPFTVISGLSLVSVCALIVIFVLLSFKQDQIKLIYYDGIAVLAFCGVVNLFSLKRPADLFVFEGGESIVSQNLMGEESNMKINLHKRSYATDAFFHNSLRPIDTYEQRGIKQKNSNYINSSEDMMFSSPHSQKTLRQSQRSSRMSRVTEQQKSSIIFQLKGQNNESIFIVQDPDELNSKKMRPRNKRYNQRLHHSLTGIYSQNRSQIQTDEASEQDILNQAISQLQEGSEKVEMGSEDDDLNEYQTFRAKRQESDGVSEGDKKRQKRKLLIQELKQNMKRISAKIPQQQFLHYEKFIQKDPPHHQNEKANILSDSDLIKFLDVSELYDLKESGMKIDGSQKALFEDSVYAHDRSIVQSNILDETDRTQQKINNQEVKGEELKDNQESILVKNKSNIFNAVNDIQDQSGLEEQSDGGVERYEEINSNDKNSEFSQEYNEAENYAATEQQTLNGQNIQNLNKGQYHPTDSIMLAESQQVKNSKLYHLGNSIVYSDTNIILPSVLNINPRSQQNHKETRKSILIDPLEQSLQRSRQINFGDFEFSQSHEPNLQLIDIVNNSSIVNSSRHTIKRKLPTNKSHVKHSFQSFQDESLPEQPESIKLQQKSISSSKPALNQGNQPDTSENLVIMMLEEQQPDERPLRQTNQGIATTESQQSSNQSENQIYYRSPPLQQNTIEPVQENHFRIQTKIKKSAKKLPNTTQRVPKQQILLIDDKKFRNLKKKLKSIEKQEQKQVKILRNIEQGRFILNSESKRANIHSNSVQKSHQMKKNRISNQITQSKAFQDEIQRQPKRQSNKKSDMELESKMHLQKIYNNPISHRYRSGSQERSSHQSKEKKKQKIAEKTQL